LGRRSRHCPRNRGPARLRIAPGRAIIGRANGIGIYGNSRVGHRRRIVINLLWYREFCLGHEVWARNVSGSQAQVVIYLASKFSLRLIGEGQTDMCSLIIRCIATEM
jgi:hypothetical protein